MGLLINSVCSPLYNLLNFYLIINLENNFYTVFFASERNKYSRSIQVSRRSLLVFLLFGITVIVLSVIGILRIINQDGLTRELISLQTSNSFLQNLLSDVEYNSILDSSGTYEEFISELTQLRKLKVRGLMAIPRAYNDHKQQREVFAKIRSKFEELKIIFPQLDTLSMGMSGDYRAAILEGTTMLRIGTGIFGERK